MVAQVRVVPYRFKPDAKLAALRRVPIEAGFNHLALAKSLGN